MFFLILVIFHAFRNRFESRIVEIALSREIFAKTYSTVWNRYTHDRTFDDNKSAARSHSFFFSKNRDKPFLEDNFKTPAVGIGRPIVMGLARYSTTTFVGRLKFDCKKDFEYMHEKI